MIADIALQTILAAIVGGIWITPLVVTPAARASLDSDGLRFFLKSFFFRFHLFLVMMLVVYLAIVYFFKISEFELLWEDTKNLVIMIMLGVNIFNLFLGLVIDNTKLDIESAFFKIIHALSVAIFASTSFVSLYYLVENFISV
jgi:hypothetical protein|tara:strand:+ start:52 stop:480 length:429 start_codon:yes stop_codon:yes gene_type:complete